MNRVCSTTISIIFGILFAILLPSGSACAAGCERWIAKAVSVQGGVDALRAGERQWRPVKINDTFCPGDMVRVLKQGRADVVLSNNGILRLDQSTTVTFSEPDKEKTFLINLLEGAAYFFSRVRRSLRIFTPFVNAIGEGTEFLIRVEADQTLVSVFEGGVALTNDAGSLTLARGQSAVAAAKAAPALYVLVRPRDAVQWALYYPPILDYRPADFEGGPPAGWQAMVQRSMEFFKAGDPGKALAVIEEVKEEASDPRFLCYRASLRLSIGRVDEAGSDIEKALQAAPGNGGALALQAIIALAQNEKRRALEFAGKAVDADPRSASGRIAHSYALQADFDLQGALASLKEAVKIEPENGLTWARLAELQLSLGDLKKALESANKAASLNPDLARTRTVLGFAYLAQIKTKMSKAAFQRAIEIDQADPLPRLGLGLAMIRDGDLTEGRGEIEIAASLDPNNSLMRSYLGKAYYEEKRDALASEQLAMAKELDPQDPTPFFYDAIQKQSVNQPVEALHDLQQSIALNDNRAVYRSRLLLDSDLAARSASLGRIYQDLGFQPMALVEGWRSLNADPSNFSAHRFLSDSYAALPRHEIARLSELLQSKLLQPINITPLQPHLALSNPFILSGSGPSEPSFQEFNPLFTRNRVTFLGSGIWGEHSTLGDEVILAGVWGRYSFSAGQFHYQSDGFRRNNDVSQNIYDLFLQASLSPSTSVQAEYQYGSRENGDLWLRHYPWDYLNSRDDNDAQGVRLGFHHAFSQGSDLIGNLVLQDGTFKSHDNEVRTLGVKVGNRDDDRQASGELQYLFRTRQLNAVAGAGYVDIDRDTDFVLLFPSAPAIPTPSDKHIHHTNLYLYTYLNALRNLTVTLGASSDFFEGGTVDRNQFNPKFGVTWNLFPSTTLRGAIFRTLRRTLINDQTIEPTQVAGFNQFFDYPNEATSAWRYGVALDQKLANTLFGGAEYSWTDLRVPFESEKASTGQTVIEEANWREQTARAYLLWAPHPWFSLSAEYLFEKLDRQDIFFGIKNAKTHRVPLGVTFFHPSGLSAFLKPTYVHQSGKFEPARFTGTLIDGHDYFWVVDGAISYRLPKRYGFVTVGVTNLFNTSFHYEETDPTNPSIQPARTVYGKITLAF